MNPDRHPRGPDEIKAARDALGLARIDDLLALSPNNDPYQCGTPANRRDAEWFAGLWRQFGYTNGVHLRRVHYQVLASGQATMADGRPYENTDTCWAALKVAGRYARYLGLVDPEAFADQRNDPPQVYCYPAASNGPASAPCASLTDPDGDDWDGWPARDISAQVFFPSGWDVQNRMPGLTVSGYEATAGSPLVQVWIEKTTMDDVLAPLCLRERADLLSGAGFESITRVIELPRRAEEHDVPAHVIYVSDFDPAGVTMPVSVARQAQYWAETLKIAAPRLTVEALVLTRAQVDEYRLPRAPVKATDRRRARFEDAHGEGVVELDALEALRPGVLAGLLSRGIGRYRDHVFPGQASAARRMAQDRARQRWGEASAGLSAELAQIGDDTAEAIREITGRRQPQIEAAVAELNRELTDAVTTYRDRLDDLARRVSERHEAIAWELPACPEPEPHEVDTARMLYDSRRSWLDQLAAYKAAKGSPLAAALEAAARLAEDHGPLDDAAGHADWDLDQEVAEMLRADLLDSDADDGVAEP